MADVIIVLIILAILASSICYIVKEKKKGHTCIGCPNASKCKKHCHCEELKEQKNSLFIRQADGMFICLA